MATCEMPRRAAPRVIEPACRIAPSRIVAFWIPASVRMLPRIHVRSAALSQCWPRPSAPAASREYSSMSRSISSLRETSGHDRRGVEQLGAPRAWPHADD